MAAGLMATGVASGHAAVKAPPAATAVAGTWDSVQRYLSRGTTRYCVVTRAARCVGVQLRGRLKHHGDLRRANFRTADLRMADLRGANLTNADPRWASLQGANLTETVWHNTTCPDGTVSDTVCS